MPSEVTRQTYPLKLLLIFLVLSAGIMISGYLYYTQQKGYLREEAGKNLSAIAALKVREIVQWKQERLGDAAVLMDNPLIVEAVRKISAGKGGQESTQAILSVMRSYVCCL